jgi:hypothetical protein
MFSQVISIIMYLLSLALITLLIGRNVGRRLVVLTLFIGLCITRDAISLFVVRTPFGHGVAWSYIFWISELVLTTMYLFMIAEISRRFLCDYPSIRRSALTLLAAVTLPLMSWTVFSTMRYAKHPRLFIMNGEQGLVLTITIILLVLMGIVAYYRLRLPPLYRLVLIGIGIYASVVLAADQIEIKYRLGPNSIFEYMRKGAFAVSLVVWTYAAWRCVAPSTTQRELIPQSIYEDLSAQIHNRLQVLNQKLAQLVAIRTR